VQGELGKLDLVGTYSALVKSEGDMFGTKFLNYSFESYEEAHEFSAGNPGTKKR
jgi:hypothetical protein